MTEPLVAAQPTRDGYAGDQTLFAPAFTTPEEELAEMIDRFASVLRAVWSEVEGRLESAPVGGRT